MPSYKQTTTDSKIDRVVLRSRDDWTDWYQEFSRTAKSLQVWEFVNPNTAGPSLSKPVQPTQATLLAEINQAARDAHAAAVQVWTDAGSEGDQPSPPPAVLTLPADLDQSHVNVGPIVTQNLLVTTPRSCGISGPAI